MDIKNLHVFLCDLFKFISLKQLYPLGQSFMSGTNIQVYENVKKKPAQIIIITITCNIRNNHDKHQYIKP